MNPDPEFDQDERLVAELHRLGVRHLVRLQPDCAYAWLPPAELIANLANHGQARFRGALILLFLRRPLLSGYVPAVVKSLPASAANSLRLFYQAATYLQPGLARELRRADVDLVTLPDLFSAELGLPGVGDVPVDTALRALGEVHARLSGQAYNWAGSYRQHLALFLRQLQRSNHADFTA